LGEDTIHLRGSQLVPVRASLGAIGDIAVHTTQVAAEGQLYRTGHRIALTDEPVMQPLAEVTIAKLRDMQTIHH